MTLLDYVLKVDIAFAQHMLEERGDASSAASYAAVEAFGHQLVKDNPWFQRIAELSIALGSTPEVCRLSPDAVNVVNMTVVKHQPMITPKSMQKAMIIEIVQNDIDPFFKGITDLGMYLKDDGYMLIGLDRQKQDPAIIESRWIPTWAKKSLVPMDSGPAYWNMYYQLDEWARNAGHFILTMALLKEAKNSPLVISSEKIKIGKNNDRNVHHGGFMIHNVEVESNATSGSLEQIENMSNRLASRWNYIMLGHGSDGSK